MPAIEMDLEQAQATITAFDAAAQGLTEALANLQRAVQDLEQSWTGNAQRNFVATWQEWLAHTQQQIGRLQEFRDGVARERDQLVLIDQQARF